MATAARPAVLPGDGVLLKKILSIDGGGIKGALPASFLAAVEEATGRRIVDHFDLIAGTSTGGIVALGVGLGVPAATIRDLYVERGPSIFGANAAEGGFWNWAKAKGRAVRRVFRSKYRPDALREELVKVFEDRRLGEAGTRLLIPAFDPKGQGVHVFKTSHHPRLQMDYRMTAVDVAMATSAAALASSRP